MRNIASITAAIAVFFVFSAGKQSEPAETSNTAKNVPQELIRDAAYATFGAGMYHAMKGREFPLSGNIKGKDLFYIKIDWKKMTEENREKFPYTDTAEIDYGKTKALVKVFNAAYAEGMDAEFDSYFNYIKATENLPEKQRQKIADKEDEIRERSIFYLAAFPQKGARLAYYPGQNYYRGGTSPRLGKWAEGVTQTVRDGSDTRHCKLQDSTGLLAIVNGTFYRQDAGSAGYGFDHGVMFPPQDGMATVAIYDDGAVKMGEYGNLPEKEKINTFAQNRYMILEKGKAGTGLAPKKFIKFTDNIIRSYLFLKGGDYIGYIWTTYMPQEAAAKLASDMGITDMMVLDLHSVINCVMAKPAKEHVYSSGNDFRKKSFNFVPSFRDMKLYYAAMKASEFAGRPIQDDAVYCLFSGTPNDLFALFLKDPQADHK